MLKDKTQFLPLIIRRLLLVGFLVFVLPESMASSLEYEIKAAFIYNFAKFVEWSDITGAEKNNILPLCILGDDPFGDTIDKLDGRRVQNLPIRVKRIGSVNDYAGCQILFISRSETDNLKEVIDVLSLKKGILSISDIDGFAQSGGVIELVLEENKVKFTVNIKAAKESDLNLSSKILRLAKIVGNERSAD